MNAATNRTPSNPVVTRAARLRHAPLGVISSVFGVPATDAIKGSSRPETNQRRGKGLKRSLAAAVAAGCFALVGLAAPNQAQAATSAYNETPYFHCQTGEVDLDTVNMPYSSVPAAYSAAVYLWWGGAWHYYTQLVEVYGGASTQYITNTSLLANQLRMRADVPVGYYSAVQVSVATNTHGDKVWGQVDGLGGPASNAHFGSFFC